MEYIRISLYPHEEAWRCSVAVMATVSGRAFPRVVRQPWRNTVTLSPLLSGEDIFQSVMTALKALEAE